METNFIILCVSLTFCVLSLVVSIISFTFAFYCKAEVVEIKNSDVAKELNMSRTTVIKALRQLTKRSIICSAFDPQVVSKSKGRLYKIMPPKTWKKYRVLIK